MASAVALEEWSRNELRKFLRSRVLPEFHRQIAHTGESRSPRLLHFTPRSAIFRYEAGGKTYAIRLEGPDAPRKHTTQAAYGWLERLRDVDPRQTRLPVLPAVAHLEDCNTMVTEWVSAPTIREVILKRDRATALAAIASALAWLEALHAIEPEVERPFRPRQRISLVERLRALKDAAIPAAHRPVLDHCLARLSEFGVALAGRPAKMCFLHHDASCANFLFDGTRAIGLDLHETVRGNIFVDYCHFLVDADVDFTREAASTTPLALDDALQDLVLATDTLVRLPEFIEQFRFHLLATTMIRYLRRLRHQAPTTVAQHARLLAVMEQIASEDFALPA